MFELKPLSRRCVPAALQKAERYRLLNEPWDAESICRDVLAVDPNDQEGRIALLLSLADQFGEGLQHRFQEAFDLAQNLGADHDRCYYTGIVCERRARAHRRQKGIGTGALVYEWLRTAMHWYEQAEAVRPVDNENSRLRWNACARVIMSHPEIRPAPENGGAREHALE